MQTVRAVIDERGTVVLLRPLELPGKRQALVTILDEEAETGLRPFGLCKGDLVVPDDFNDPLPEHVLKEFEGS